MTESLFSPSWYRVAGLKPRLRSHAEIHRHQYRGEIWYVLQDHSSGRFQRFTPAAYELIGLMDGRRTVQEIWDTVRSRLGEDAPTQEEVIRLLSQIHAVDALHADILPDTAEMLRRFERQRHSKLKQNIRNPIFMRFPLLDPERILNKFQRAVRPFFGWPGAILWLVVVGAAVFQAGLHWPELTENITDRILAPRNLLVLALTFLALKICHEFAHGFAVKIKGGEVHEMGIMLLVFTPIPYVDASSASAFREKRDRVLVGAAGMGVELFLAALAMFVWVNAEPGPIRSVAYNAIFAAGVSSLLFNGNPLLRYDAYYILADLLEIPNLGPRGLRYLGYLTQRYVLGVRDAEPPLSTQGERVWFVLHSVSSFIYRMFIFTAIALFVASKFFFVGVLFACWALFSMFVLPAAKGLRFLLASPRLRTGRMKAILTSGLLLAAVITLFTLVPLPLGTQTEGVMWIPEDSFVRAGTDGFVDRVVARSEARVKEGDPLVECSDPFLAAEIRVLEAQLEELEATYDTQRISDRVQAEITKQELDHVVARLEDARERTGELTIRSPDDGVFVLPMEQDLPGRFVPRGELMGYVLDPSTATARVVVAQADLDLVRNRTRGVKVRLAEDVSKTLSAVLLREVPAATDKLPAKTLSQEGGGEIAIDPRDVLGIKAFQKIFLFDVDLISYAGPYNVGGRVYVRFDHGWEPLVWRLYRGLRQLFLRRFRV